MTFACLSLQPRLQPLLRGNRREELTSPRARLATQLRLSLCRLAWLQEVIVSATVMCAGLSSALGGAFSDAFGRKRALLLGDGLFAIGAVVLAAAGGVGALVTGELHEHHQLAP